MIEFKNVMKSFKNTTVLKEMNLTINKGELVVFIGPSGCGKTTSLKMINRLVEPTEGTIIVDGQDTRKMDPIQLRRQMGYVIQQTGLFPHMTIRENIQLIASLEGQAEQDMDARTEQLLRMVGLEPEQFIDRYPSELSGGQQQRIGFVRALMNDPKVILMDEPFSALDPVTRSDLQEELFNLQEEVKKTIVFVTHDMDEAIKLADRICIMRDGEIVQFDTPEQILRNPKDAYVESFIGKNRIWNSPEFIKAKDIMITDPVSISGKRTVLQAIEIMRSRKVDSLLITDREQVLQGLIKLKDVHGIQDKTKRLEEVMNVNYAFVSSEDSLLDILDVMNTSDQGYLPVVTGATLNGLITRSSLLSVLSEQFMQEEETL
ncbi:ATP-binding cassette domain-containing protein [Exiguobacterium sp. SH3S2]|uniref:ABC transporter ATP-binding protein n=2 Tax=Exiguobacterium TaxID=33986 RepID=UPI00103C7FAE|nr:MULTISPECIES: ABC transporter ATP-binding protein [unclassified Exiguobacterium]TCI26045.1 ATP-binding cassette domain-containing protein [Exiguobacterium sp. SH5S4]TCI44767.1 ATP-binding cassette domain-containing protein [Exiguobacterium sp. SH3S3]TCI50054.1 ATP-binding cassette domain-containing protein [Exiguobacterium sp. SH5S13]TCI60188.1 ATP-binding cassette domain-containing protein [Exiguobacterium sp. SH3S2]TCI60738.1 ATP-binding cassette domain-containing protein [Exiguobacterium